MWSFIHNFRLDTVSIVVIWNKTISIFSISATALSDTDTQMLPPPWFVTFACILFTHRMLCFNFEFLCWCCIYTIFWRFTCYVQFDRQFLYCFQPFLWVCSGFRSPTVYTWLIVHLFSAGWLIFLILYQRILVCVHLALVITANWLNLGPPYRKMDRCDTSGFVSGGGMFSFRDIWLLFCH